MALDINTAGTELVKTVITLYRTAKYFREKEVLANQLLHCSIEAGRLTNEVSLCAESEESYYARRALEELSKATFALKVMGEEGIYPQRRVTPVAAFCDELKALLKLYVKAVEPAAPQPAAPQPAEAAPAPAPAPQPQDGNEQLSMLGDDVGGFNEVYTGKL